MKILVFDTCLDKMYVTLSNDKDVLTSKVVTNTDNKYHSAFLISTIREVLKQNNLTPTDIDVVGTNIGPGSFTGIRACTTVARMMAQQLNIPAVGISSLEILSKINPTNLPSVVITDARKNCAYFYMDESIKGAVEIEQVKKQIEGKEVFLITDNKMEEIFGGISYQKNEYPLGDILAELVYKKITEKDGCEWRKLKPLYIQPPGVNLKGLSKA